MTTAGIAIVPGTDVRGVGWVAAIVSAGRFGGTRLSGERADLRFPFQGPAVEMLIHATTHEFWGGDLESVTLSADRQELELIRRSGDWISLRVPQGEFPVAAVERVQSRIYDAFAIALQSTDIGWRRTSEIATDLEAEVAAAGTAAGGMDWACRAFELVNRSTGRYERLIDDLGERTGDPVADCRRAWLAGQLAPCFSGHWDAPAGLPAHGGCSSARGRAHAAIEELAEREVAADVDLGSHLLAACLFDPCVILEATRLLQHGVEPRLTGAVDATLAVLAEMGVDLGDAVRGCSQIVL